jgi:phosphopantothenate-cysteine ligase
LIAEALKDVGPCSMFYLAAAVSDFYVPWKSMTEHKIESGSGPLDIRLAQVPKMLSVLRSNWAPKAFCISFKVNLSLYSLFFLVLILRNPMMYMQILDSA